MSSLQSSPFRSEIGEFFQHSFDFDFLDLVADCLDRIDDGDAIEEQIDQFLNTLPTDSLWCIMRFYQLPMEANMEKALEDFSMDVNYIYGHSQE